MLVLTRKAGERLMIGAEVVVTVISTHRGKVQLGVSAPPEVSVHREEVHNARLSGEAKQ